MHRSIRVLLISCLLCGCATKGGEPESLGPFYYLSAPSEHGYQPPGDLSRLEAQEIAERGHTYYMAYFNSKGKANKILKVSGSETQVISE